MLLSLATIPSRPLRQANAGWPHPAFGGVACGPEQAYGPSMSKQFSAALWSLAAAIPILLIANASPVSGWAGDTSMMLMAVTFLGSIVALAIASSSDRMQLSLQLMTIYFSIYLVLPGYNHTSINIFPFYNFSYPDDIRTTSAVIVLLFIVCVALGYTATQSWRAKSPGEAKTIALPRIMRVNNKLGLILTAASAISMVVFIATVGLSAALGTREALDNVAGDVSGSGFLVTLPRVITFFPVVYGTLLVRFSDKKSLGYVLLTVNLPIFLLVNFPGSLPRGQVFGIVLLFMMLTLDFKKVIWRGVLSSAYVFGALVAMPLLNHFSRNGGTLDTLDFKSIASSYFSSGDFDGYQSVANAVIYVDQYGIQSGIQILSAILFFIPRSLWVNKGEPTGSLTAETAGYSFTNISQPLPSEFYVDFSWAGVVIGGLLLGVAFCRYDRWVDQAWTIDLRTRLATGWLMGFGLLIFRGTLLGVLPPLVIVAAGLWVIGRWGMQKPLF